MSDIIDDLKLIKSIDSIVIEANSENELVKAYEPVLAERIAVDLFNTFGKKVNVMSACAYVVSFNRDGENISAEFNNGTEAELYASMLKARNNDYIKKHHGK